ncbi:MAG: hypothetical protein R2713_21210 [Ilumatobacteraceae bacterium]|nr:hypothetical protein [Acidimicrobiales bacterium]MCB9394801.1 hypothetical protein [Acidimicrobiaceae bacterium]
MATSSSSSSAKKVAKLAQRGKGKKVRFQGGTLFPAAVLITVVLGLLTIVYARQSRPDPGSFPPQVGDHWHAAYGMYVCDGWLPKLIGAQEETTLDASTGAESYDNPDYGSTGIHSHADGVIHYHPFTTKAVGRRAKLGIFLDVYDIELNNERLALPEDQGGDVYDVEDYQCNGEDVEIKVVAWDSYTDTGPGLTYITDFPDIRITNDGMVFAIAVVPVGTDVEMPPWAAELPQLGAVDGGNVPTTTVAPGDTTAGTTDTGSTESTEPADTDTTATTEVTTTTGG